MGSLGIDDAQARGYHPTYSTSEAVKRRSKDRLMQITEYIYATHIEEDPSSFGAMHPGGTHIYFVGDPDDHMVMVDSGEPYRAWTKQIVNYHAELGKPRISAILITHGHGDHIGGLDRLQEEFGCIVRCHPKLEPALTHRLGRGTVEPLRSRESVATGGGVKLRAYFTPGHEVDHVSYYMAAGKVVFSGDTILGNSSSSVRNLKQYMASLEILAGRKPNMTCPDTGQTIGGGTAREAGDHPPRAARAATGKPPPGSGRRLPSIQFASAIEPHSSTVRLPPRGCSPSAICAWRATA